MHFEQIFYPVMQAVAARPKLAGLVFAFDPWGNPLGESYSRDPTSAVAAMHREGAVTYRTLYRHWVVTGYDEALEVLSRDDLLVGEPIGLLLNVRPYSKLSPLAQWTFRNLILVSDPPDHTRLRRMVHREFTSRSITRLEGRIEATAYRLLERLGDKPDGDLTRDFTRPLANAAVASLIGIPEEDWDWSQRMTDVIVKLLDPLLRFDPETVSATIDELYRYFDALAEQRKQEPKDDFITAMVRAEGEEFSRKETITMALMMLGAGSQTTGGLVGNSILALSRFPDQQALLRENPKIWPNAVEEFCRFDTSVKFAPRYTPHDMELAGKRIPAGSNIMIQLVAANRDPRRYDEPDRLRLDRPDPQPLTFGYGIHFCLGAALTRMVLEVGIKAFLDVYSRFDIEAGRVSWRKSLLLRGATRMPFSGVRRQAAVSA